MKIRASKATIHTCVPQHSHMKSDCSQCHVFRKPCPFSLAHSSNLQFRVRCQVSETALRPCTEDQSMHIFASDTPPSWLEGEMAVAVPLSETHSIAIQLYTGACSLPGTNTAHRCRPECAGPASKVCDAPLGAGIAMCEKKLAKGPLAALRGNDITLVYSDRPTLFTATGQTSGSVSSHTSRQEMSLRVGKSTYSLSNRWLHSFHSINRSLFTKVMQRSWRMNPSTWTHPFRAPSLRPSQR